MPQFYAPQPSAPPPGNPYLSPVQSLIGGATAGYQNAQAAQAQAQQQAQQAAAQASLKIQLAQMGADGSANTATIKAGSADRATAAREFASVYATNTKASGLSDTQFNQALTHLTDGIGNGSLDPELAGRMMSNLRGSPPAGGSPPQAGTPGGTSPGGTFDAGNPQSATLTDSRGNPLGGQKAGDAPPGGRGFGLDALRSPVPPGGQSADGERGGGALPPAPAPAQNPPLPLPGGGGILEALRASNPANIAAPPPPGQAPSAPVPPLPGAPALTPGTPALTPAAPPALPPQPGQPPPAAGIFSGLGPGPMTTEKLGKLAADRQFTQARTTSLGGQDQIHFQAAIATLPPEQQAHFVQMWNERAGTNFPVPGRPLPMAPGVQGPPAQTPAYTPNLLQGADIDAKRARTGLDVTLANLDGKKFDLQKLTQQQQAQYQNRTLDLKARGLSDAEATRQAQVEIQRGQLALGQGRLGLDRTKYLHPNAPDKDTGPFQAKFSQRLTQLMAPGKIDYMGNPGEPLVKLDKAGQPSGPGANEYLQLMHLMRNATGGGAGPDRVPRGFAGAMPKSQADFQKMPPAQQKAYVLHLRALNGH